MNKPANFRLPLSTALGRLLAVLLAGLLSAALVACSHIQLIGDYDEVIDQGVSAIQKKAETYYAKADSDPSTPYDASFYSGVDADLAVLITRADATPKYTIIKGQLTEIRASMKDAAKFDKLVNRPITSARDGSSQFKNVLPTLEQQVGQILKLELALKRGEDAPGSTK